MEKTTNTDAKQNYSFYSRVLEKPFDTLEALMAAEATHFEKLKAKEDAATEKKNDAKKVEAAFKDLNATRKSYKELLAQLTTEYAESLENLKKAYEHGQKDLRCMLESAENNYAKTLKEFTDKYDQYHLTLKDGDFETTVSSQNVNEINDSVDFSKIADIFNLFFGI